MLLRPGAAERYGENMEHNNSQVTSYDTSAIQKENRQSWVKILSIWMGLIFSTATMLYGGVLGTFLDLGHALLAIVCGTAILALLSILISNIGADTGLSCYELMKYFLGNTGGRIVSVMFISVMLGWSGIGVIVVVEMMALYIPFFATPLGFALGGIGLNIIFVGTVWSSFKGLSFFSRLAVPIITVVFVIAFVRTGQVYGLAPLFEKVPVNPHSFPYVVSGVVACWINAPLQAPDISRFSRSRRDTLVATILAFVGGATLVYGIGAVTGVATGVDNIPGIFDKLGIASLAVVLILLLTWTSSAESLYSSSLAFASVLPIKRKELLLGLSFVITTTFTMIDLYAYFTQWVDVTGLFFCPIIGLFLTDHYCFRKKYTLPASEIPAAISIPSIIAVAIGIATNLAIADYGLFVSIFTTSGSYFVLNKYAFADKTLQAAEAAANAARE